MSRVTLTMWKQLEIMRCMWPGFQVLNRTSGVAHWEGQLHPLSQTYTVQIVLYRERRNTRVRNHSPVCVTVEDPLLRRRPEEPSEPIPHHYPNSRDPGLPLLCLYDPAKREWDHSRPIANTIVPWTIDWLGLLRGLAGHRRVEPAEERIPVWNRHGDFSHRNNRFYETFRWCAQAASCSGFLAAGL